MDKLMTLPRVITSQMSEIIPRALLYSHPLFVWHSVSELSRRVPDLIIGRPLVTEKGDKGHALGVIAWKPWHHPGWEGPGKTLTAQPHLPASDTPLCSSDSQLGMPPWLTLMCLRGFFFHFPQGLPPISHSLFKFSTSAPPGPHPRVYASALLRYLRQALVKCLRSSSPELLCEFLGFPRQN